MRLDESVVPSVERRLKICVRRSASCPTAAMHAAGRCTLAYCCTCTSSMHASSSSSRKATLLPRSSRNGCLVPFALIQTTCSKNMQLCGLGCRTGSSSLSPMHCLQTCSTLPRFHPARPRSARFHRDGRRRLVAHVGPTRGAAGNNPCLQRHGPWARSVRTQSTWKPTTL